MPGWYRVPGSRLWGFELIEALRDPAVEVEWPEAEHKWTFLYDRRFDAEVIKRVNERDFTAIPEWACEKCGLPWDGNYPRPPRTCSALREVGPATMVMEWVQRYVSHRREERHQERVDDIARSVIEEAHEMGDLDDLDRQACYGIVEAADTLAELWRLR